MVQLDDKKAIVGERVVYPSLSGSLQAIQNQNCRFKVIRLSYHQLVPEYIHLLHNDQAYRPVHTNKEIRVAQERNPISEIIYKFIDVATWGQHFHYIMHEMFYRGLYAKCEGFGETENFQMLALTFSGRMRKQLDTNNSKNATLIKHLQQTCFENILSNGDITHNEQYLLQQRQCFQFYFKITLLSF